MCTQHWGAGWPVVFVATTILLPITSKSQFIGSLALWPVHTERQRQVLDGIFAL